METKHTQGPWKRGRSNSAGNMEVTGGGKSIACVYTPNWGYDAPTCNYEAAANANLIASAPELLEALEKQAAFLLLAAEHDDWGGNFMIKYHEACAAIAKARGEA